MPSPPVDRPLDAARVAVLIAARFPEARGTPERIGAGWDNEMYRVGEWFFRGDPVIDFVELVAIGGYAFTDEMRRHYTLAQDPAFAERLRWAARALSLYWLDKADPDARTHHQRWLLRAFEG